MSKSRLCFLSLVILFSVIPASSFIIDDPGLVPCRPSQIQAFTQFMSEFVTRGCSDSDYSNGVSCDNSTGAITNLQLNACLTGTLMPNSSLFKLRSLRYLDLSYNNFTSTPIPSEFGNLDRLEALSLLSTGFLGQVPSSFNNLSQLSYLILGRNHLTGSFPHVRNLTKLSYLSLSSNHFSGPLNTNCGLFELHHLRVLNLDSNNFSSPLPSEFGNLNKLQVLSLSANGFFGQVPATFSNLTQLTSLYLDVNELTGSFPQIQNLTELSILQLAKNSFSGTIPSSLLTMPSLSSLDLSDNHLTGSFEIPTSSSLETLFLGFNQFEAQILEPISKLTNLKNLDLQSLNITHPIDLGHFSSFKSLLYLGLSGNKIYSPSLSSDSYMSLKLEQLYLSDCGISEFPEILKTLQNLTFLDLSTNKIRGKIPEWLWSLPRLEEVAISDNLLNGFEGSAEVLVNSSVMALLMELNKFEGELPLLPLSIKVIIAGSNNFTGEIPLFICNRSSLLVLQLSYNSFTGPIPQCVSNFTYVNLRKNHLKGSIPNVFNAGTSLRTLDIGFNQITGKLPRSLLNCSSLSFLSVDNNNIEDTFPFWLKALPNLQVLTLRSNKFYGSISPPHHGPLGFPKLRIFEISNNKFNGSLSPTYFVDWASSNPMKELWGLYMVFDQAMFDIIHFVYPNRMDLQYKGLHMEQKQVLNSYSAIDFSGNQLEGNIPESIGFLKALIALNLSNNAFTGHIPLSLGNLKEVESLDMSRNKLSGTIPNGLGSLSFLAFINVSHNQLKGEIPQGPQITGQAKSSFEGNAGLCGIPLDESCYDTSAPPIQHHKQEGEEEEEEEEEVLNWKGVAIGYGLGVLFGLAIAHVIVLYKPEWVDKVIGLKKRITR